MRENRTHGSEGGEDGVLSYPYFIRIATPQIVILDHQKTQQ